MSILSLTFIAFIAVLCVIYFLVPKKFQWMILLIASFVFYLSGGWQYVYFILITIISQYILALKMEEKTLEYQKEVSEKGLKGKEKTLCKKKYQDMKKRYVLISVLINVGLLAYVKYAEVLAESLNQLIYHSSSGISLNVLVPLGISFYTFKSLSYIIDVYRGREKAEQNIFKLALYISYFPAIVQGPIDRYGDLAGQLTEEHTFNYQRFLFGMQRILWGYIKKLVIAERIAVVVNEIFGNFIQKNYSGCFIFLAAFLYGFQIYADFSGGMDIVNGISEILGIQLTENFCRPYLSKSVAEFWKRWHITLGAWMRTYLFYPISLSKAFSKLNTFCRKKIGDKAGKTISPSLASFIVFILVGIWHGVGWKYVWFGVYHAILVSTHTLFDGLYGRMRMTFHIDDNKNGWKMFQIIRTVILISLGRLMSRAADMNEAVMMFKRMFARCNFWVFFDGSMYNLGLSRNGFYFMILSIIGLMIVDVLQERGMKIRQTIASQNIIIRWGIYLGAISLLLIFGVYGSGYDAASFIYQKF